MDKNSLIGFLLIGGILAGFWFLNKPDEQELARQKQVQDSVMLVRQQEAEQQKVLSYEKAMEQPASVSQDDSATVATAMQNRYGEFASFTQGEEKYYVLENDKIKLTLSNKGARIYSVLLKEFEDSNYEPLVLFEGDQSTFGINFFTYTNREIATSDMFFDTDAVSEVDATSSSNSVTFKLKQENGNSLSIQYALHPQSYLADIIIDGQGIQNLMSKTDNSIYLSWSLDMPQVEKGLDFERRYSGLYYKHFEDKVENIKGGKADVNEFPTRLKWVGFKDQFFSSVLIANKYFSEAKVEQIENETPGYIASMRADLTIPVSNEDINLQFYFGPNHYQTLRKVGYDLHKVIDMGWPPVKYVNQWIVIPVFNFLSKGIENFGIIILILTIFIKLIIFPFTYKSYISTAKMRVLKPQIDEATKKFGTDKQMEKQQATMAIYKKAGVNPMGGCLPMLFQFPILVAMFYFFPSSIELRHESFLWAQDLASYDAVITWEGSLPLIGNLLGNHISLFTLLMSITNIFYTMINQEMTASTQQMKGMKTMMYLMPVMFFFMFNKYAAGLSYYYFISTLITIGQTFLMRRFVNEANLLSRLEANKKKPTKKSKFAEKLEKMQKEQQSKSKSIKR